MDEEEGKTVAIK